MSDGDKLPKRRASAEIELVDGRVMQVLLFVSPQGRILDMLNDGRAFLPVENGEGEVAFLRKEAIRRVTPAAPAKDKARAEDAGFGRAAPPPPSDTGDPYELLGVSKDASGEAIREAYRQRCRENHPDRLQALGLCKEYVDLATKRMAAINAAYDRLRELRRTAETQGADAEARVA
jgi:hypothetical protein